MANICFHYVYRDTSNYKNWGEVVFQASEDLPLNELEQKIRAALIDGEFFYAENANIPTLYFDIWRESQDVTWHAFSGLSTTNEPATVEGTIEQAIATFALSKMKCL
jgi:hypothetical protein